MRIQKKETGKWTTLKVLTLLSVMLVAL